MLRRRWRVLIWIIPGPRICQACPEKARKYGVAALKRALEGIQDTTAVHLCFGYAAIIHDRPLRYSFLSELADTPADQVSRSRAPNATKEGQ